MDWLDALQHLRTAGLPGVLVTVTEVRGHAPREAGAKMVVGARTTWDSVGGGNLEATVVERARVLLATGATDPETMTFSLNEHAAVEHGRQCCGGVVSVLLEPQDEDVAQRLLVDAVARGEVREFSLSRPTLSEIYREVAVA